MLRQPCSWRGIPSPSQISNQNSQRNWRRTKFTESPTTLQLQCYWAQWEGNIQKNLTWKTYLVMPPNLLSFCLGATYNVLPSPTNLKRWHLASESRCFCVIKTSAQYHISWKLVKYPSNKADLLVGMAVYYNIWYWFWNPSWKIFHIALPKNATP